MATNIGLYEEADQIFSGVRVCRPDSPYPDIGMAVLEISRGHYKKAVRMLRTQALKKDPENDLARCFIGLALTKAGTPEKSAELYEHVINAQRDPQAVALATALQSSLGKE